MSIPTLDGVTAKKVTTARITTRVLFSGPQGGVPVLFLHGNLSSATWWEEVMVTLPPGYRGIAPDQRSYGEADPDKKIDATRGMGDLADDAAALLDHLNIDQAHIVGSSMGGSVVWRMLMDYPQRFISATQVAPGSPFGFSCTKDVTGTPCYDDFAGSGAGLINPEVVERIAAGDRSTDSQFSPRNAFRTLVVKPPFIPEREEELLSAMLAVHTGEQDYPGDKAQSPNWPYTAPGVWGPNNALSPKYIKSVAHLYKAEPKVSILWIRGSDDLSVSDKTMADPGTLGAMGVIPNWPGADVYPPQPMVSQTRHVLQEYAAAGGAYQEIVMEDTGHVPYIEKLEEFNKFFHAHIRPSA